MPAMQIHQLELTETATRVNFTKFAGKRLFLQNTIVRLLIYEVTKF